MNVNFPNALSEVFEIVERFPKEYKQKIPSKFMDCIIEFKNDEYEFQYDSNKSLAEQNISETAKDLIAFIYLKFINSDK